MDVVITIMLVAVIIVILISASSIETLINTKAKEILKRMTDNERAVVAEIAAGNEDLKNAIVSERAEIKAKLDEVSAQVTELETQISNLEQGTPADLEALNAIRDSVRASVSDVNGIFDANPVKDTGSDTGATDTGSTDQGEVVDDAT